MKKLKVLKINDAVGGEVNYFLTDGNILVDIHNNINTENINIKKAIESGVIAKTFYYVEEYSPSNHFVNFDVTGFTHCVEWDGNHGVIFDIKNDALRYERYISLVKDKIEVNGYEVIKKENAIKIVEEIPLEEVARLLIRKQIYKSCGSVCYLNLEEGIIDVVEDTKKLMDTDIVVAKYYKNDFFGGAIVNGIYNEEYHISFLASMIELDEFRHAIEEFYVQAE